MSEKHLSLEIAKLIAEAAEKKALESGIHIVISIYDNHGNLKYFCRMDNTSYGSIRVSKLKAKTSASFPISTKALNERSTNIPGDPYQKAPQILSLNARPMSLRA